ncbi:MAG: hypothetical protein P4L79_02585 [Legionella sp.]|uniref:hypothetical protein n=1 Tax=Legionella sp. TaxID=459 RepID=UPI002841BC77|nr:hypothetical protein [Legionella sp.]
MPGFITIDINKKTDRFFIAIAKTQVHSFIFFGVYNQFKVDNLLSRVGKVCYSNKKDVSCSEVGMRLLQVWFSGAYARLIDEGIFRRNRAQETINYQAYDIRYEQYLEYLTILSNLSTEDIFFRCYQPHAESDEQITLKFGIVPPSTSSDLNADKIKNSVANLSTRNTCRHSAIDLVEAVQKEPVSASVSKYFFYGLPYKTEFLYGQPNSAVPFYVLPVPPSAYVGLGAQKERILKKLYERMERLPLIEPNAQETMDKFSRLKELYNDIAGPQKDLSLDRLLTNIQSWKSKNLGVLDSLREKYIWDFFFKRTSATMLLVGEIESELKKSIVSPGV